MKTAKTVVGMIYGWLVLLVASNPQVALWVIVALLVLGLVT